MIKILTLFVLVAACAIQIIPQNGKENRNIKLVENSLLANAEVVFADSVVPKFNIYERMKFYKVPSVSVALINNGSVEWVKAYGLADITENRTADINTVYQAASISKTVNALCVMKLVQDKKLFLDEDIRGYLKTWKLPENNFSKGKKITLRNLLSHTAGLGSSGFMGYEVDDTIPDINDILNGKLPANSEAVKPVIAPNAEFKYSGGGTLVIKKILQDSIAQNYDSLLEFTVLKPLGMENSTFRQPLNDECKNFAAAYNGTMEEIKWKYHIYPEQAPDGLWTTAADLAKMIISVQQSLKNEPKTLLTNSTVNEMLKPTLKSSDAALGVFITKRGDEYYFNHRGANVGYRSNYYGSFTSGKGVVVLTNSDNGQQLIDEIINGIAVVYNWQGFYTPITKKLCSVPDSILNKYTGEYESENPAVKITIIKKDGSLELTARRNEKMYPLGINTFFIMSSPSQNCVFSSSTGNSIDTFEVKEGTKVMIKAMKIK